MKIVSINSVDYGSTGQIMMQVANETKAQGHEAYTFSMEPRCANHKIEGHRYFITYSGYCIHNVLGKITGGNGLFSIASTWRLLHTIESISPDIIHLHNLHAFCINLPMLFSWLKKRNTKVVWTLHDCWAFTGHCPHYALVNCDRWKTGCHSCPIYHKYPRSYIDNSRFMWEHKKLWFTGLKNTTIVTPSKWLAEQVQQSYLKDYPVQVIYNGIDLAVFKRAESGFRMKYGCINKKIVLGVAFGWRESKGLDVFIDLFKRLDDDYRIVLVGTDDKLDSQLPENIISIHRTRNQVELARIYSTADVFVNPTREETLGLVNVEALACGTPVITFDAGGSPECIDETCGIVAPRDDVEALEKAIRYVCEKKPFTQEACVARAKCFDKHAKFQDYVDLYEQIGK